MRLLSLLLGRPAERWTRRAEDVLALLGLNDAEELGLLRAGDLKLRGRRGCRVSEMEKNMSGLRRDGP